MVAYNFFISSFISPLCAVACLTVDFNKEQKWASPLVKVLNERKTATRAGQERSKFILLAFMLGSGDITQEKLELVNAMLFD